MSIRESSQPHLQTIFSAASGWVRVSDKVSDSCPPQLSPFVKMLMQMHIYVTSQATRIYVSSSGTVLKRKLMWVVTDFWAHRVAALLFAGWLVWGCAALHHTGGIYLFISRQAYPTFFKGARTFNAFVFQWLSSKYNSNYCESQGKMLRVESSSQWQNKRDYLSSGGVKLLGWKCCAGYICVYIYIFVHCESNTYVFVYLWGHLEKNINIDACTWTHTLQTHRDTDLSREGAFS